MKRPYKYTGREAEYRQEYNQTHREKRRAYNRTYNKAYYLRVTKPKRRREREAKDG